MRAPVHECCEAFMRGRQRLKQRVQLVMGDKHDGRLGVVDDELHSILSQRVIERHAVHALPIACLFQHQISDESVMYILNIFDVPCIALSGIIMPHE